MAINRCSSLGDSECDTRAWPVESVAYAKRSGGKCEYCCSRGASAITHGRKHLQEAPEAFANAIIDADRM